jgi:hypothetical protein
MYLVLPMKCTLFSPWHVPCSPHDMYLVLPMKCTLENKYISWGEQGTFHRENKVHIMGRTRYISWGEQGTFHGENNLVLIMKCTLFSPWHS